MSIARRFWLFVGAALALLIAYHFALAQLYDANRGSEVLTSLRLPLHYAVPALLVVAVSLLMRLWRLDVSAGWKSAVVVSVFALPLVSAMLDVMLACAIYRRCF